MQVFVHLLVAYHRECRILLKTIPLILPQDPSTVRVQVDVQYDIRLFGDYLDAVLPDIAPFEVCHVGVAQPRIAHEKKDIARLFEMALLFRYFVFLQLLQLLHVEEYHPFRSTLHV